MYKEQELGGLQMHNALPYSSIASAMNCDWIWGFLNMTIKGFVNMLQMTTNMYPIILIFVTQSPGDGICT